MSENFSHDLGIREERKHDHRNGLRGGRAFGTRERLGHVSLETTNRYAEITLRTKEAALKTCMAPALAKGSAPKPPWRTDTSLMSWLDSL